MGGTNPYLDSDEAKLPQAPYALRFVDSKGETIGALEVDPAALPERGDGVPGSLLRLALRAGVELDHACGGVCACSTCHVIVRQGLESCNEASEDEEDMLDHAPGLSDRSRLACQAVPDGSAPEVVVCVPSWNRNLVSEGH